MQHLPRLTNLYALNVVHFRSNDTCPWVMRETRRFLIDTLSHHREMKLEWLAVDDDSVVRILRGSSAEKKAQDEEAQEKKKKKKSKKGKAKVSAATWAVSGNSFLPGSTNSNGGLNGFSDSDSDIDTDVTAHASLETIENIHFYDAWGVRIFKKEVMDGRL